MILFLIVLVNGIPPLAAHLIPTEMTMQSVKIMTLGVEEAAKDEITHRNLVQTAVVIKYHSPT